MTPKTLLLASASPRRAALLTQMGLPFEVVVTDVDEQSQPDEPPADYVRRLAEQKARVGHQAETLTIGADTTVCIDNEILGKPCGPTEGVEMLLRLAGRAHEVYTGVAIFDGERLESSVVVSTVHFRDISSAEAQRYWQTGEPADKAGGYGIQGIGGIFVRRLEGSYSAVVGLPIEQTEQMLALLNFDTWSTRIDGRRTPH